MNIKIAVYFNIRESCTDTNRFEIKINDDEYLNLPYEAPSYDPEMEDAEHIKACIMVNGAQASNCDMPWYSDIMQEKIDKVLKFKQMMSFAICNLDSPPTVTNELLDLLTS